MVDLLVTLALTDVPLKEALERAEKELFLFAMKSARYNQSKAAALIGVSRQTLRTKLDKYYPGEYIEERETNE